MATASAKKLQPPISPSGQRSEGDKKAPASPSLPPSQAKSTTAKATASARSHGGDSTATKDTAAIESEKPLRSLSGDVLQKRQSLSSSSTASSSSLEERTTEQHSERDELYRNVQDLLGEVLACLDAESFSKKDNQQGMILLEDVIEATGEDMPTDLRPTFAPSACRSGVDRASCDLTVRFADSDDPAQSRPDSPASVSRPKKNAKTAVAQVPIIKNKNQQPQPPQGTSLWPFHRSRVNAAPKPGSNAAAASTKVQSQSKQPLRRDSIGQMVDTELVVAMDRKISWGKAKEYPGSVTLSELNDDGTGTSKTRSLKRIKKKKKPAEVQPQNKGGTSLLRSILGIVSSSQKTTQAPTRPQVKGAAKRPAKVQSTASRQPSGKGSPSGSKGSSKQQRRKEKKAAVAVVVPKENQPLPPLMEVPENAVAPDDACIRAAGPETPVAQIPDAIDNTAADAVAVDAVAVQEPVAEAASQQCAVSDTEMCIVPAGGD
ncbi:hypothetical protein HPB51_026674 [Rhipicephalus microplus]|uniref:Uncharacterized protein n=1 Tax=Rhipicephalus microplus TaxID=6941 RepID=A0A9J6D2F3_RHIMP|nr:hypothetical protein HPB51_026674 [Rhipicephalus microplus]